MKPIIVILSYLIYQSSASIFDDFGDTMSSIGDSLERVITDVLTDVKETIDCSIFAVQQVLKLDGVFSDPSEYKKKCNGEGETSSASDETRNENVVDLPTPQVTYEFKAQDMTISSNGVTKEVSVAINKTKTNVNKTLCKIFDKGNTRTKLQNAKNVLKTGSDHLTEVSAILSKELDNIVTDHKSKYDTGEPKSQEPAPNRVRYKINVLNEIKESNGSRPEAKEISNASNKVLLELQTTNKSNHDNVKLLNIIKASDKETNSTKTKLLLHWNEIDLSGKKQSDIDKPFINETAKANTISVNFPNSFKDVAKKIIKQSNAVQKSSQTNGTVREKNKNVNFRRNSTNYLNNIIEESDVLQSNDTIVNKILLNDTQRYAKVNMTKSVEDFHVINASQKELNVNLTLQNSSSVTTKISEFKLKAVKGKSAVQDNDLLQDRKDFKTNTTKMNLDSNVINGGQKELKLNSTRKNRSSVTTKITKLKLEIVEGKPFDKGDDLLQNGKDLKKNMTKIVEQLNAINARQEELSVNSTRKNRSLVTTKISKSKLETVKSKSIEEGDALQYGKDFKTNMTKNVEDSNVMNASQKESNVNLSRKNRSSVTSKISELKLETVKGKSLEDGDAVLQDSREAKMTKIVTDSNVINAGQKQLNVNSTRENLYSETKNKSELKLETVKGKSFEDGDVVLQDSREAKMTKIVKDSNVINAGQKELNVNSTRESPNSVTSKISELKLETVKGKSLEGGDAVLQDSREAKMTKIVKDSNVINAGQKQLNVNATRENPYSVTKNKSEMKLETVKGKSLEDGDVVLQDSREAKMTKIVKDSNVINAGQKELNVNSTRESSNSVTTNISEFKLETVESKSVPGGDKVFQDCKDDFKSMNDEEFEEFLDSFFSQETD